MYTEIRSKGNYQKKICFEYSFVLCLLHVKYFWLKANFIIDQILLSNGIEYIAVFYYFHILLNSRKYLLKFFVACLLKVSLHAISVINIEVWKKIGHCFHMCVLPLLLVFCLCLWFQFLFKNVLEICLTDNILDAFL